MFAGCLTLIMMLFVPIEGGPSFIFLLSVPIGIALGVFLGISYWYLDNKSKKTLLKNIVFYTMLFLLIVYALLYYPYKN